MPPDEPKTPAQQISENPDARADRVVDVGRAEEAAARASAASDAQVNRDRVEREGERLAAERAEERRASGEDETAGGPEFEHEGVTKRLLEWMRARGMLSHRELVEILGIGDAEIDHRHPDSEAWETKEVTVNGVTRQQRIGKASVAEDSVAARHYVQELLRPGSTRPPDEQEAA